MRRFVFALVPGAVFGAFVALGAQSLTPPPSLSGSNSNLALAGSYGYDYGLGGSTRLYSAAPGAEAKFRNGSLTGTNGLFGSSLFPSRMLAKR